MLMSMLFQDELTTRMLISRITREIKEEQLAKVISNLDYFNKARTKIITKYDLLSRKKRKKNF